MSKEARTFGVVTAASVALTGCGRNAMDFCHALEIRDDLARDCTPEKDGERGRAATFKVRDGSQGRVVLTDDADYLGSVAEWGEEQLNGKNYFAACRECEGKKGILVWFPPTLDTLDRDQALKFDRTLHDIAKGEKPEPLPKREHPTRSIMCRGTKGPSEDKCGGAGMCAVKASDPTNCLAAFDADCRKSRNCADHGLCEASSNTGLCVSGGRPAP